MAKISSGSYKGKKRKRKSKAKIKHDNKKSMIIIGCVLAFGLWLSVKIALVYSYNSICDYNFFIKGLDNQDTYTISESKAKVNDYVEYEDIKFVNSLDSSFESSVSPTENDQEMLKYYSKEKRSTLTTSSENTFTEMYVKNDDYYKGSGSQFLIVAGERARENFLEKNGISNDIELFELMKDAQEKKVSIFTPIHKIREYGTLKIFSNEVLPSIDGIVLYDGVYEGYAFVINDRYKEINIWSKDKRYVIELIGTYFTDEVYTNILSTLEIS